MKNFLFVVVVLFFMASCSVNEVNFLSPQPESVEALTEIPNEYHGEFKIDGDTHIVTSSTIDGLSIFNDSVVVKKRGSYVYVNTMNNKGSYNLVRIRRVNFLNHESIYLDIPQFDISELETDIVAKMEKMSLIKGDTLSMEEIQSFREKVFSDYYQLFNVVGDIPVFNWNDVDYTKDIVLKDVTVNQLSILLNASTRYNVERIR